MKYLKLNDDLYRLKNIRDLTIKEYKKYEEILNIDDEIAMIHHILNVISDLEWWQIISLDYFSIIQLDWVDILKAKHSKMKRFYTIGGEKRKITNFSNVKLGNWIDINYMLQTNDITMIVALLMTNEDYDQESINILMAQLEDEMTYMDALAIFRKFIAWRLNIYKKYENLFAKTEEEEEDLREEKEENEEEIKEQDPWLTVAYQLTNDDITKKDIVLRMGIVEVLNWMAHQKEKRDAEENRTKNKNFV